MHEVNTDDILRVEEFIINKINDIENNLNTVDIDLPMPSDKEMWRTPDKFAVMKTGGKRAIRIYDTYAEALEAGGGDYIDIRRGESKKLEVDKELAQLYKIVGYTDY